jgi:hypothetical protein
MHILKIRRLDLSTKILFWPFSPTLELFYTEYWSVQLVLIPARVIATFLLGGLH